MESLREFLAPKTVNKFSFIANVSWFVLGLVLSSIFLDMEINESRSDFRCGVNDNQEHIQGQCYEQYEKRYNKLSIPVYGFVICNFFIPTIICVIYSQYVKSRVGELEEPQQPLQPQRGSPSRKLFKAYCFQLVARFLLGILFISLQTKELYPKDFSSNFRCSLMKNGQPSENITQTQTYECHNQRATYKNFWTYFLIVINGIFACLVLIEVLYILSRVKNGTFMEDSPFYASHIRSHARVHVAILEELPLQQQQSPGVISLQQEQSPVSSLQQEQSPVSSLQQQQSPVSSLQQQQSPVSSLQQQQSPLEQPLSGLLQQKSQLLQASIRTMKNDVIKGTERPRDLQSPFLSNPGESNTPAKNLTLDQIYTDLNIREGRANPEFSGDRQEQLKVYPESNANLQLNSSGLIQPQNVLDAQLRTFLVCGRPGIGKTIFCTKTLRDWASSDTGALIEAQNLQLRFVVAFLLKFRRFNSTKSSLTLRELLDYAEYSESLNDAVWEYVCQNPTKVLLIFDGIDEFNAKSNLACCHDSDYRDSVEQKMPFIAIYNKLAAGKILAGATILTTTRTTAVYCVRHIGFDRTVEILGFTSEQVEKYVKKFTEDEQESTGRIIWQHISSNLNIFSLCYVPVNCFIICTCLLHFLQRLNFSDSLGRTTLPPKLTDIYSIAIKIFYFKHNDKNCSYCENYDQENLILEPFDKLPEQVKNDFKKLGEIAFKGIEEGRLIFESNEVEGLQNCALLHRLPDSKVPNRRLLREAPKAQFCFMHLTVQEFLAAKHVSDTMSEDEQRLFVTDKIQGRDGKWQVVLQFVAGLLDRRQASSSSVFIDTLPESTVTGESHVRDDDFVDYNDPGLPTLSVWPLVNDRPLVVSLSMCLYEIDGENPALQTKLENIGFNSADFSNCQLGPVGSLGVVNLLKRQNLLSLNLMDNTVGTLGCLEIQTLLLGSTNTNSKCNLSNLDLSFNGIVDEDVKQLVQALTCSDCKLSSLNLRCNNLGDEGLEHLVQALTHKDCKLRSLNLSDNEIRDTRVKHLIQALTHSDCKLDCLTLSKNGISDEDVKYLAEALKHKDCKLSSLDLSQNNIGDEDVRHLAEALKHRDCKLSSFCLRDNEIRDKGIEYLVQALTHKDCKLKRLDISGNDIRDKGIELLVQALSDRHCKLGYLDLKQLRNEISKESTERLVRKCDRKKCTLRF